MISVQKAIFPGIALGCIFLVFITNLIARPGYSLANSLPVPLQSQVDAVEPVQPQQEKPSPQPTAAAQKEEPLPAIQPTPVDEPAPAPQPTAQEQPASVDQPATELQPAAHEQPVVEEQPPAEPEASQAECKLNSGYPEAIQQWCDFIQRAADEHGLDPNLVAAVIMQESGGSPDAYSKNGAVGLMQVMPRDGLAAGFMCANGPCFSKRPSIAELSDPEFNINYGVGMLAGLIQRYGDVREGLRSYGPMNMGYRYADIVLNIMARYQ